MLIGTLFILNPSMLGRESACAPTKVYRNNSSEDTKSNRTSGSIFPLVPRQAYRSTIVLRRGCFVAIFGCKEIGLDHKSGQNQA
jgi:hypothetical protein